MKEIYIAMNKVIGGGWFSGEKTQALQSLKQDFLNVLPQGNEINDKVLAFFKKAAEPRFGNDFENTRSCLNFFSALSPGAKDHVIEVLGAKDSPNKDFIDFITAVKEPSAFCKKLK